MRRFWWMISLLLFAGLAGTEAQTAVTCFDETQFISQATLTLPDISAENPKQFIVTTVGLNDYDPIIATTIDEDFTDCVTRVPEASVYEATLPTIGNIPTTERSTQTFIVESGRNIVNIGEVNDDSGEFLTISEGIFLPDNQGDDVYTLSVTDAMRQSGAPLMAYMFALEETVTPALSVSPANSDQQRPATPVEDASLFTDFAPSVGAVSVPIPTDTSGDVTLTVPRNNSTGIYALALYLGTGDSVDNAGTASVTTDDDGSLILRCDDVIVSNNAVQFTIPAGEYTVTAMGSGDYDPVMALMNADGSGTCYDDSDDALGVSADLPTVDTAATENSARASTSPQTQSLVIGARDGIAGELTVLLNGATIDPADETDAYALSITPGMVDAFNPIDVYMIATDNELNPFTALMTDAGEIATDVDDELIRCDDAGIPVDCYGNTEPLPGYAITLATDEEIATLSLDSHLAIPLELREVGSLLTIRASSTDSATSGSYALVLHLVTDAAEDAPENQESSDE